MEPITRTIREQIVDRIRDQVVAGDFEPGQPLREVELAERFGVSRGPIREAFLRLAQEGILLAYEPNRGVTVSPPPKPENREVVVSLRRQLETTVAKRGLRKLEAEDIDVLSSRLRELRAACEAKDAAAVARCDLAFHETLLLQCGGHDFLPIWKWLCSRMLMAYGRLESFGAIYREHKSIVEAIRSGRWIEVKRALEANIQ